MRTIELHKVNRETHSNNNDARFRDSDDPTENGGEAGEPRVDSSPVVINVEAIRCFYSRTQDRPGTRITFIDGGGFAVVEAFEDVKALVAGRRPAAA